MVVICKCWLPRRRRSGGEAKNKRLVSRDQLSSNWDVRQVFAFSSIALVSVDAALLCLPWYCVTQLKLYTLDKLCSTIFCWLWVCEASVSPDQISTFSNIYRHTSPLLTMYHLISSSTNLYWPSTSQYRHILTQYHQVPLIIHHLMIHAQYTWSSLCYNSISNPIQFKDASIIGSTGELLIVGNLEISIEFMTFCWKCQNCFML